MHNSATITQSFATNRGFSESVNALVRYIGQALEISRQRRALGALGFDALDDLGISAVAADHEANKPFWA